MGRFEIAESFRRPRKVSHVLSSFLNAIDKDKASSPDFQIVGNDETALSLIGATGEGDTNLVLGDFYDIQSLFVEASRQIAKSGSSVFLDLGKGGLDFFPVALVERRLGLSPQALIKSEFTSEELERIKQCFHDLDDYDLYIHASEMRQFYSRPGIIAWKSEVIRLLRENPDRDLYCLVSGLNEFDYDKESDELFETEVPDFAWLIQNMSNFAQDVGIHLIVGGYSNDVGDEAKLMDSFGPSLNHKGVSQIILFETNRPLPC